MVIEVVGYRVLSSQPAFQSIGNQGIILQADLLGSQASTNPDTPIPGHDPESIAYNPLS